MSSSLKMEHEKIESIDALKERMEKHNEETICLYKSAVALGAQNDQFFMDWQDLMNKYSQVQVEDL